MEEVLKSLIDTYIKAHPWIVFVFVVSSIFVNVVRIILPAEKKRPKWLNAILYIVDIGASNFWGLMRFSGLKLKLPIMIRPTRKVKRKYTKKKIKNKTTEASSVPKKDTSNG